MAEKVWKDVVKKEEGEGRGGGGENVEGGGEKEDEV